jgi:chaperone required for assembly of F1-ATPase
MKRFYTDVAIEAADTGFIITLDGRQVKTPGKSTLVLPTAALAEGVAAEWRAQGEEIDTDAMPLTRLANTALDRVKARFAGVASEIAAFAETDLLCYRADEPATLVKRQEEVWGPYLAWASETFDAHLGTTSGIMPVSQPKQSLAALRAQVDACDAFELTALHEFTNGFGSLVLALAYLQGFAPFDAVWKASILDQTHQEEKWGEDSEVIEKRDVLRSDMEMACEFLSQVRNKITGQPH